MRDARKSLLRIVAATDETNDDGSLSLVAICTGDATDETGFGVELVHDELVESVCG